MSSALQEVTVAARENQAFSLMSRLHVILRRHSGHITDVEYMRIDPAYCRYVLELAEHNEHADLPQIRAKLEEVFFGSDGLFVRTPPKTPLLATLNNRRDNAVTAPERPVFQVSSSSAGNAYHADPVPVQSPAQALSNIPIHAMVDDASVDNTYIGRLR